MKIERVVFGPDSRSAIAIPGLGRHQDLFIGKLCNTDDSVNRPCEIIHMDWDPRSGAIVVRKKGSYPDDPDARVKAARMWNYGTDERQKCAADWCAIVVCPGWTIYGNDEQQAKKG